MPTESPALADGHAGVLCTTDTHPLRSHRGAGASGAGEAAVRRAPSSGLGPACPAQRLHWGPRLQSMCARARARRNQTLPERIDDGSPTVA